MQTLIKIQGELNAPKDKYNKFGQFYYRSAEGILEAVKPLLKKEKALLTLTDEPILLGDKVYIKATAIFTHGDYEKSVSAVAREADSKKGMDASQISGTASSYARKYALNGLFLIDDNKDADTDEFKNIQNKAQDIEDKKTLDKFDEKVSEKDAKILSQLIKEYKVDEKVLLGFYDVKNVSELTIKQATDCKIKLINKYGNANEGEVKV